MFVAIIAVVAVILAVVFGTITVLDYLGIKLPVVKTRPWNGMKNDVDKLASQISQSFQPNVVVGIEGGGIMVGGLLVTNWLSCFGD